MNKTEKPAKEAQTMDVHLYERLRALGYDVHLIDVRAVDGEPWCVWDADDADSLVWSGWPVYGPGYGLLGGAAAVDGVVALVQANVPLPSAAQPAHGAPTQTKDEALPLPKAHAPAPDLQRDLFDRLVALGYDVEWAKAEDGYWCDWGGIACPVWSGQGLVYSPHSRLGYADTVDDAAALVVAHVVAPGTQPEGQVWFTPPAEIKAAWQAVGLVGIEVEPGQIEALDPSALAAGPAVEHDGTVWYQGRAVGEASSAADTVALLKAAGFKPAPPTPATAQGAPAPSDPVKHPSHYTQGGVECIDGIEAALGRDGLVAMCRGNALKYVWRAGAKVDTGETPEAAMARDLRKATWYLNRAVAALTADEEAP